MVITTTLSVHCFAMLHLVVLERGGGGAKKAAGGRGPQAGTFSRTQTYGHFSRGGNQLQPLRRNTELHPNSFQWKGDGGLHLQSCWLPGPPFQITAACLACREDPYWVVLTAQPPSGHIRTHICWLKGFCNIVTKCLAWLGWALSHRGCSGCVATVSVTRKSTANLCPWRQCNWAGQPENHNGLVPAAPARTS